MIRSDDLSIYIHFPYCLYKCFYCDFNSYAKKENQIPYDDYLKALISELDFRSRRQKFLFEKKYRLKSIFFGGGTPSLMKPKQIETLLKKISFYFDIDDNTEITLEANPKTIDKTKINDFLSAGINRFSLGVQSLNDKYLQSFGRIHSANESREALKLLSQSNCKSWNADLIFGFPGQSFKEVQEDCNEIVDYQSPHLSFYAFSVEEEAPYKKMLDEGRFSAPDSDLQADLLEWIPFFLESYGYQNYEISNFSKKGFECQHNLSYWRYQTYLSLGAGAVSLFHDKSQKKIYRETNPKKPEDYFKMIHAKNLDHLYYEAIDFDLAKIEFLMMGLRLREGCNESNYFSFFDSELRDDFAEILRKLQSKSLISANFLSLTPKGRLQADAVIREFL